MSPREKLADAMVASLFDADRAYTAETVAALRSAFNGNHSTVEFFGHGANKILEQGTWDCIYDELDQPQAKEVLQTILKDSRCPLVADLKRIIINGYVGREAAYVAEARARA